MPKTINDPALVNLPGANIDEAADRFHIWDASAGQDKHVLLNDIITRIAALQSFFSRAPDYDSGEQAVNNNSKITLGHGLGAVPRKVEVFLRCKTDSNGYTAGQEILANPRDAAVSDFSFTVARDATNIIIVEGDGISVLNPGTFNQSTLTEANWRWVVRAWK